MNLYILISIVAFGFWGLFVVLATKQMSAGSVQLAYSSSNLVYTLALTAVLAWIGQPVAINRVGFGWAAIAAFTGVLGGYSMSLALQRSDSPGIVNAVIHASPILTLLLTVLFVGETVTIKSLIGSALVIAGLVIVAL